MKTVLKHITKNIMEKKMRSILIIVSLIIATTVFVLNLTLPGEIVLKLQETMRSVFGNADISIVSVEDISIDDIKTGDENIKVTGISGVEGTIDGKQGVLLATDILASKEMRLLGNDVTALNDNEVVMTKELAKEYGYEKGDIINFIYEDKTYEFVLVMLIDSKGIMSTEREFPVFVVSIDKANEITGTEKGHFNELYIDVENDDNAKAFSEYLSENNENCMVSMLADIESIEDSMSFIESIMLMVFLMATIMIFFVVSSLTKIIIAERMPVIGTFRSIGASKYKMNAILVLENMLYGLIGGIIGCIAAYGINSSAASVFITTNGVELSDETSSMSAGVLCLGIAFAIVLEFFISFKAIRKANKKPIKDIIFNIQSTRYIIRKKRVIVSAVLLLISLVAGLVNDDSNILLTIIGISTLIVGVANLVPLLVRGMSLAFSIISRKVGFATGVIAGKNIGYNKMIISSARLIVVSLSLMIAILTVSGSVGRAFQSFRYIWDMDIMIMNVSKTAKEYDNLIELEGVKEVDYLYYWTDSQSTYNDGKEFTMVPTIIGLDKPIDGVIELDYKITDLKNNEILIDEVYAKKNNISVNDTLKIKMDTLNKEIEYKVAGLVNGLYFSSARNVCVVNMENFFANYTEIPIWIQLKVEDGTDLVKLKDTLKEEIKEIGLEIMTFEEYLEQQEESTNSIMSLFYIIIALTGILSLIGIFNNQIIGFIQRRKELAVLNSTCMSKGQIKGMLMTEIMVANAIACVIAIVVGYFTTGLVETFMIGVNMYIKMEYDWLFMIEFVGIIYLVLMMTLIIPSRRIDKINIVNEIKYE